MAENTVQVAAVEMLDWNPELHELAYLPPEPLVPLEPPSEPQAEDPAPQPPVFSPAQQPAEDGVGYPAADGRTYYRPGLRVADRAPGLLAGPDVWFQRDPHGALRLDWTLTTTRPAAVPADAVPLRLDVMQVRLLWEGDERQFDPPTVIPVSDPGGPDGPGGPEEHAVLLRGGADLLPADARALELAMADAGSGCHLELHGSFAYAMYESGNGQLDYYLARYGMDVDLRGMDATQVLAMFDERGWDADHRKAEGTDEDDFQAALPVLVEGRSLVVRQVPFVFDPRDEQYEPIYRALHGTANLSTRWRRSAVGWVRDSGFPNTVYRLPDELRLAFNPDLGTPHVITTLHQGGPAGAAATPAGGDGEGTVGVRVLMRVAPWQDPRQVVQTRELVGARTAQVVVGPVASAVLRLGGSFPEGIRVLGASGDGVPVPLTGAADLLLDLSLEYFQLLCGMIGGAVGLPGQVEVTLTDADPDAGAGDGGAVTVTVPVNLRMDTVQDLPVSVELPAAPGSGSASASTPGSASASTSSSTSSPTVARITNRAGTAVRIGGCAAVFVQASDSSVVPLGTRPARCVSAFPIELAAGASTELVFEVVDPRPGDWWNAVLVELLDKAMVEDAAAVLLRANQVAGSGELTWTVRVSCPVFAAQPRPQRWANLVALEVEITAPGFDTTTVVLDATAGATTITMRQPLVDLVAGRSAGVRTATFRVRNNYTDHQGSWTAPQQQSGTHLIVYPNQAEND